MNIQLAESFDLTTTPHIGWVATFYFYAALHLVDALLAKREKIDPGSHEARKQFVVGRSYLRGIRYEYKTLKDRSEDARYRLITFTRLKIERDVIPLYKTVETHILPQLE